MPTLACRPALAAALVVGGWGCPLSATPSVIDLKSGAQVRAEVLAERPDRLVVDLGFMVMAIPREEIDRVALLELGGGGAAR